MADVPQSPLEDQSVRHLIELGYEDPDAVAAARSRRRQLLSAELEQAQQLIAQGRLDEAEAALKRMIGGDSDWPAPRQRLAEIYYNRGRWAEAQAELDWLTYHGWDNPRLALMAGGIALAQREFSRAEQELRYAVGAAPTLPSAQTLLGVLLIRLRRFDEAEHALRHAVQQNQADARACDGMAVIHLQREDFEAAADWALQALEHDMQLYRAHLHLGVALLRLNRTEAAMHALEASARVEPWRAAPFWWLAGIARDQLKDPARAARYRERGREAIRQRRIQRRET